LACKTIEVGEITQNMGYYAVQDHSRTPMSVRKPVCDFLLVTAYLIPFRSYRSLLFKFRTLSLVQAAFITPSFKQPDTDSSDGAFRIWRFVKVSKTTCRSAAHRPCQWIETAPEHSQSMATITPRRQQFFEFSVIFSARCIASSLRSVRSHDTHPSSWIFHGIDRRHCLTLVLDLPRSTIAKVKMLRRTWYHHKEQLQIQ